jgi:hypothetical protein
MKSHEKPDQLKPSLAWGTVMIVNAAVVLLFALLIFWDQALSTANLLIVGLFGTLGAFLLKVGDEQDHR